MDFPLFFNTTLNKHCVILIGARHSYEIDHPQYKKIENIFKKFQKYIGSKTVLVEGEKRKKIYTNLAEAVSFGADGNFITFLAREVSMRTASFEPSSIYELKKLNKQYDLDHIELFYFLRFFGLFFRQTNVTKLSPEDFIENFIKKQKLKYPNYAYNKTKLEKIFLETFKMPIDYKNKEFFFDVVDRRKEGLVIQDIARTSYNIRNQWILKRIDTVTKSKHCFLVIGASHFEDLKKALKKRSGLNK